MVHFFSMFFFLSFKKVDIKVLKSKSQIIWPFAYLYDYNPLRQNLYRGCTIADGLINIYGWALWPEFVPTLTHFEKRSVKELVMQLKTLSVDLPAISVADHNTLLHWSSGHLWCPFICLGTVISNNFILQFQNACFRMLLKGENSYNMWWPSGDSCIENVRSKNFLHSYCLPNWDTD